MSRPLVRGHLEAIGSHLARHGSVNVDYLLADSGVPRYIDANPRLVEPVNAAFSGVNLADLLVRLSLGVSLDLVEGRPGVTSHMLVQALLGMADRDRTWPGNWPEPRPARGSTPGVGRSSPRSCTTHPPRCRSRWWPRSCWPRRLPQPRLERTVSPTTP